MVPGRIKRAAPARVWRGCQPAQQTRGRCAQQHKRWPHPEAHSSPALAYIMQQRRNQQITINAPPRLESGAHIETVALIANRHRGKQRACRWRKKRCHKFVFLWLHARRKLTPDLRNSINRAHPNAPLNRRKNRQIQWADNRRRDRIYPAKDPIGRGDHLQFSITHEADQHRQQEDNRQQD